MNEPDYSIPLLLQDPLVIGRRQSDANDAARLMRQADEIEARRDNVIAIAKHIADAGYCDIPGRTLTSLQLAVEMLRNAEKETET